MRIFAALVGIVFSVTAFAADTAPANSGFIEGKDYALLDEPLRPADPSKIEVTEVFAYTCPHCFHFEPIVEAWAKTQKSDVAFVQLHANWNPSMEPYQRGYYTVLALKLKDKAHANVFKAIHEQQKELATPEAWADFLSGYGANKQNVIATFNSFAITNQLAMADARARGFKISGTPEMVVDGKYRISTRMTGSQEQMLKVVDFIVEKIRAERASGKH